MINPSGWHQWAAVVCGHEGGAQEWQGWRLGLRVDENLLDFSKKYSKSTKSDQFRSFFQNLSLEIEHKS